MQSFYLLFVFRNIDEMNSGVEIFCYGADVSIVVVIKRGMQNI